MPENAEKWTCDKPIYQNKVGKTTRCTIACIYGHDVQKGKSRNRPRLEIKYVRAYFESCSMIHANRSEWHRF